jgi:site-specific recombinase XerC
MSTVSEVIRENKPNITSSSLRSYVSMLNSLQKKLHLDKSLLPDVIEEYADQIKKELSDRPPKYRKTILSALVSVLIYKPNSKVLKSFREQLLSDSSVYENEVKQQKLTNSQEDGYIDWKTILEVKQNLADIIKPLIRKKNLDKNEKRLIQQYALVSLYTNMEPRRALEIATLKVKPTDKEKDNYIDKNNFVFNAYKTAKYLGKQTIAMPKETQKAIKDWLRIRGVDSEFVFLDSDMKPLTSAKLGNQLRDIFDPINVSVNILRHSYIKHMLGNIDLEKIQEMANGLGQQNIMQTLQYIKKDTEKIETKNKNKLVKNK